MNRNKKKKNMIITHHTDTCKSLHVWEKYESLEDKQLDGGDSGCHMKHHRFRTPVTIIIIIMLLNMMKKTLTGFQ